DAQDHRTMTPQQDEERVFVVLHGELLKQLLVGKLSDPLVEGHAAQSLQDVAGRCPDHDMVLLRAQGLADYIVPRDGMWSQTFLHGQAPPGSRQRRETNPENPSTPPAGFVTIVSRS